MNSWIDLSAVGQILLVGLLAGAGLPAIFALGLRALAVGEPGTAGERPAGTGPGRPLGLLAAGVCFIVVVAAIGYGIDLIVNG
jgi:hypothetical protein